MAISNRERVDRGLVELRKAIKPICERRWFEAYGSKWLTVVNDELKPPVHDPSTDDPAFLLKGIIGTWDDVWRNSSGFGSREQDWVWEIRKVRNRVAHHKPFNLDDADRALGTIERLLASFKVEDQQEKVKQHRDALLRQRHKKLVRDETPRGKPATEAALDQSSDVRAAGASVDRTVSAPISNHERVELCQDELQKGLVRRCRLKWSKVYGAKWRTQLNQMVSKPSDSPSTDDLVFLLQGVVQTWDDAWSEKHGREVRGWVSEAYNGFIDTDNVDSFDDANRMLDTIERILKSFGAIEQKKRVREHRDALLRKRRDEPIQGHHSGVVAELDMAPPDTESVSEGDFEPAVASIETAAQVRDAEVDRSAAAATASPDASPRPHSGILGTEIEAKDEGKSFGSLGAALLSAGFGSDGSLPEETPETEPEPTPPPPEVPAVTAKKARKPAATRRRATSTPGTKAVTEPRTAFATEVEEEPISPYDKRGSWYVIHAYSGHEKKVKANLATRSASMHMQDRIFEVVIPTEKVVEFKGGRKVEVEKRMFPGYLLIRMYLDDDSWHAVRNTPGVTSFVGMGSGNRPTSLSKREVERFLGLKKEAAKKPPRFRPAWEIGETVRVSAGPFADFNGVVEDINVDQQKVTVLVEIFGRDTPMELGFEDIQKQ